MKREKEGSPWWVDGLARSGCRKLAVSNSPNEGTHRPSRPADGRTGGTMKRKQKQRASGIKAKRQEPRHQTNPRPDLRRDGKMEKEKGERKDETGKRRNQRRKKASVRQGTAGSNRCVPLVDHPDGMGWWLKLMPLAVNRCMMSPCRAIQVCETCKERRFSATERGASHLPIDFSLIKVNRTTRPFGLSNLLAESDMIADGRVRSRYCLESSRVSYLST